MEKKQTSNASVDLKAAADKLPAETMAMAAPDPLLVAKLRKEKALRASLAPKLPAQVPCVCIHGTFLRNGTSYKAATFDELGRLVSGHVFTLPKDEFLRLHAKDIVKFYNKELDDRDDPEGESSELWLI